MVGLLSLSPYDTPFPKMGFQIAYTRWTNFATRANIIEDNDKAAVCWNSV